MIFPVLLPALSSGFGRGIKRYAGELRTAFGKQRMEFGVSPGDVGYVCPWLAPQRCAQPHRRTKSPCGPTPGGATRPLECFQHSRIFEVAHYPSLSVRRLL